MKDDAKNMWKDYIWILYVGYYPTDRMEDLKKYKILNLTAETCKEYLDNT
jgi:hypothetical protein